MLQIYQLLTEVVSTSWAANQNFLSYRSVDREIWNVFNGKKYVADYGSIRKLWAIFNPECITDYGSIRKIGIIFNVERITDYGSIRKIRIIFNIECITDYGSIRKIRTIFNTECITDYGSIRKIWTIECITDYGSIRETWNVFNNKEYITDYGGCPSQQLLNYPKVINC